MGAMYEIVFLLLKTAFSIYLIALVARFLAQLARADFYNPLAQTVVKITNPIILPLRKIIPGYGGLDNASLLAIYLVQLLYGFIISTLAGGYYNFGQLALYAVLGVAGVFFMVLFWSMLIVAIASWVSAGSYNPLLGFIAQMIEPFVGPFRRLGLQVGVLDLSFMVAILVLYILQNILLLSVAKALGYGGGFFIGL
ncbi:YggT family protein [Gynuella sunshinyii]|uniref:Putative integral membrane protein n=1 Tax=Gynuella sunshinyii YC6258 TaxID=1445510 RepID=A0A0C5V023_9GAMM|nr:YggT family protein [Gynuella sunshinyii]AJQ92920.1 putative integral membrane protein [Gynuella sunshinyii YC6258]